MIPERLSRLRREMEQRHIDVYIVPTADFHESEYVGAHFKARSYITGFTGSAGTAIITMTEAGLWTDARYFLQAKHQLENTGVTLYRMGEEGVPTIMEYLRSALPEGGTLGFDGRVINARLGAEFLALAEEKNAKLAVGEDLVHCGADGGDVRVAERIVQNGNLTLVLVLVAGIAGLTSG